MERPGKEAWIHRQTSPYISGLAAAYRTDLPDGIVTIRGKARVPENSKEIDVTAIPYFSWSNREPGRMKVWLPYAGLTSND